MRKALLSILAISIASFSFSQSNTISTTGNIGIGTLNPAAKLDVNGRAIIDSSLIVKDSLVVEKRIHAQEQMIIDGLTIMNNSSTVNENFKVLGNTTFEGDFKLSGIPNSGINSLSNNNLDFILINSNGNAHRGDYQTLMDQIRSSVYQEIGEPSSKCDANVSIPNPTWTNGPDKIYSYCPQVYVGVGTNTPQHSLDVRGRGHFSQYIGVGTQPNVNAQITTKTNKEVGICVDHNYLQDYGYAYKAIINKDETKGLGIYNAQKGADVFSVFGTGQTLIGNPNVTEGMVNISSNLKYGMTIDQISTETDNTALNLLVQGDNNNYALRIFDKVSQKDVFRIYNNGRIYSTEVNVALKDDFPDYVFCEDYNLMPLNKLNTYIQENGHLPGLQPAKYYESNGINTSELHLKEVEKIEELTLYVIELKRELDQLKKQLNDYSKN